MCNIVPLESVLENGKGPHFASFPLPVGSHDVAYEKSAWTLLPLGEF
jgi:hypothetical protein